MAADDHINKLPSKRKKQVPFSDFMQNMDQLFGGKPVGGILQSMDDFFHNSSANRSFPIEMIEEPHAYIIKAKLPGIRSQQIHIEVYNQSLSITVRNESQTVQQNHQKQTTHSQRSMQTTTRNITFLKPIYDQNIVAEHKDGLLEITVPKLKGKEIKIIK